MRLTILSFAFIVSCDAHAFAQEPTTLGDLRAILDQSAQVAKQIPHANEQFADAKKRANALIEKKREHDANQCLYPDGHPEDCAAYDEEARSLDTQAKELLDEYSIYENEIRSLTSQFQILMARLRIARLLKGFKEWVEDEVVPCTDIPNPIAAQECLDVAWGSHP